MTYIGTFNGCEIWHDNEYDEFYVYGLTHSGDPVIAASLSAAKEKTARNA